MSDEDSTNFTLILYNLTDRSGESSNSSNSSSFLVLLNLLRASHNKPLTAEELLRNAFIICCYSLIVVVSLCGNLLVIKVIAFGKRKMCTTTNILIASLAFSDIVMTAFNIPFNVARLLLSTWPFGGFLCVSVPFVQVACVYVSTFTMTVIAAYRWWTLSRTTANKSLTTVQLAYIIGCVWLLAAILSVPHSIFNKTIIVPTIQNLVRCHVVYPELNFDFALWLSVEAIATQYLIPLSITCVLYIKIGFVVSRQGSLALKSIDNRKRAQTEARRRRIIMLVLVVAAFAICWLPLNLYHLLADFRLITRNRKVFIVCHWFAMSSVCYNPFIYCYLNTSFRNGAKKMFMAMRCSQRSRLERYPEEQTCVTTVNNRMEMTAINADSVVH